MPLILNYWRNVALYIVSSRWDVDADRVEWMLVFKDEILLHNPDIGELGTADVFLAPTLSHFLVIDKSDDVRRSGDSSMMSSFKSPLLMAISNFDL
jgi:hypothetical protein